jgi:hypothetical protein
MSKDSPDEWLLQRITSGQNVTVRARYIDRFSLYDLNCHVNNQIVDQGQSAEPLIDMCKMMQGAISNHFFDDLKSADRKSQDGDLTEMEIAEKAVLQTRTENAALRNLLMQVMEFTKVQAELLPEEIRASARKGVERLRVRISAALDEMIAT